eukprot:CAMPEP_0206468720 /NCGR_PEP_ID=MMETSP0324_2-20121206/29815_1 /ASSEMBLY_ACC=CAM_ASM_000836 /TAXON_ID=2866 /ORGANISM="Crypthecodinium cohnii, Strain Seligo" /LENGTH=33 /DNA_ID= /DNA_START= /DNA_END= /DNA_ORIENTATION=
MGSSVPAHRRGALGGLVENGWPMKQDLVDVVQL